MGLGPSQCCSTGRSSGGLCGTGKGPVSRERQDLVGITPTQPPGVKDVPNSRLPHAASGPDGDSHKNAESNGPTTKVYEDGSVYTGQLVDGKRHGEGTWRKDAQMYEGQWEDDKHHGRGSQTWGDGRSYEGNFERGHFSGYGRMVWQLKKGQLTYEGQYKGDLKHGRGKFTWADGRVYDGEWQSGKRHGTGVYTNASKEQKTGLWKEDQFEGWITPPPDNAP
mmetsp:Transcript_61343/g.146109  ORF Transcript_61343/g.146109 Transcript_61343/m.146109 type:complete len:222 (-) Transcript_61343:52-717(-)